MTVEYFLANSSLVKASLVISSYFFIFILDMKVMEEFSRRYSMMTCQVKTRIMNLRKCHKDKVASTAKEMEMEF
jgi:hypothetical protein